MPSLKEIKGRIGSVKSTLKITSAMKLVASAKLRKAQLALENMRPYRQRLDSILADLQAEIAARQDRGEPVGEVSTLYTAARPEVHSVAIVAMASNSSLCGGFNANALRLTLETVEKYRAMGVTDITVFSIGRKIADAMKKCGYPSPEDFTRLAEHPSYEGINALAASLMEAYAEGRYDRIDIVHNHFVSSASQKPVCEPFLPAAASSLRSKDVEGQYLQQEQAPASRSLQTAFPSTSSDTPAFGLKIFFAEPLDPALIPAGTTPGTVLSDGKTYFAIATADGALSLKDVQLAGKKRMDVKAFLAGFRDPASYRALPGTSRAELEKVKPLEDD